MAVPETRNWHARENAHKPEGWHLLVGGQVEVPTLNTVPNLSKRQARDAKTVELELTLAVAPNEPGGDQVVWRAVDYHEVVERDQYDTVVIMWDDNIVARIGVVDDDEHSDNWDSQMAEHNAAAAKTIQLKPAKEAAVPKAAAKPEPKKPEPTKTEPKKPELKKPAPKKAAAKKAAPKKAAPKKTAKKSAKKKAPKAVGGWAKKAKKKTGKKSAKKAAKTSGLKRFVKKLVKKLTPAKKKKKKR